jgi:methionyl aminopeptidase
MEMSKNLIKYDGVSFKSSAEIEKIRNALAKEHYQQIPIKTPEEIEKLKVSGGICARILDEISPYVKPGATKKQLNDLIQDLICNKYDAEVDRLETDAETSASDRISACFGHNNIIVNAEPDDNPLQIGDIFGIDISIRKNGWCGDTRKSWIIGDEASPTVLNLFTVSQNAMWLAISMIRDGVKVEKIANAVEEYANKHGISMLKLPIMAGHSLGKRHIDGWLIPLFNTPINKERVLKKGMVITIETFMSTGNGEAGILNNDLTSAVTTDDAYACYWEHAVAVTEKGCEILDLRSGEQASWADLFSKKHNLSYF